MREVLASAPDKNEDCYKDRDPAVAFVDVKNFIATKRNDECDNAGYNDANVDADGAVTYSGQGLATYDSGDNSEPSYGCSIEKQDDTNAKETMT
jgi:hypothetical protein